MPKPNIGVTGPEKGGWPSWICTRLILWQLGAKAIHITPKKNVSINKLSGLILCGGADIDPARYQESLLQTFKIETRSVSRWHWKMIFAVFIWVVRRIFSLKSVAIREDKARDELEFRLLDEALKRNLPVFGICRGAQLINVYFGGSLHQDIQTFYVEEPQLHTILPRKTVHIEIASRLYLILKRKHMHVNSLHSQSVKDLGRDLQVVARETNGIVQAIEHMQLPFVLGVQWHPEFLSLYPQQRRIFEHFVRATKEVAN